MKLVKQLRAFFDFALDDRSVRIGRLIFAVVLVIDLIRRWQFSEFFFSDSGVLTHEAWMNVWGKNLIIGVSIGAQIGTWMVSSVFRYRLQSQWG